MCTFALNSKKEIIQDMENYLVSARKYRPATFDTVVGQDALTATLKNAIATNKLAHAYLFCGPRGVGKTTCARIFAKTINCLTPTPSGEACDNCESCVAFNEQRSFNIHELDAASNNSVEDIRQLVEMVRVPPQVGKYKVYIIDEVHMLSAAAFNAFLKTLEEPPMHAVFILATTEKHKILPTILSRCQIYDFNRIRVEDTVNHLMKVAEKEGVTAEPEALNVIALKADGGMRDALSIFDQTVSYTRGNITYQGVIENLNVLDYDYYFKLTESFLSNNVVDALLIFNDILNKGFEGSHFITGLASHFRDLLVSKDTATLPLLQVGASIRERYGKQAQLCSSSFLFKAMKLCNDCDLNLKASKNKRLLVELTLIQVAQLTEDNEGGRPSGQDKTIKPAFNKQPQAQASSSASKAGSTHQNVAKTAVEVKEQSSHQSKVEKPVVAPTTSQAPQHIQDTNLAERLKSAGVAKRKIPVVTRETMGVSVKRLMQQNEAKNGTKQVSTSSKPTHEKLDTAFTEADLNYQWQSYINQMPIEQKALAVRMQGMRVLLLDPHTFEMVVDNELLAREYIEIKPHIEAFMRRELKNDFIQLNVRVSEPDENVKVFTKTEKFQVMAEKNKALYELKNEFGLEFY